MPNKEVNGLFYFLSTFSYMLQPEASTSVAKVTSFIEAVMKYSLSEKPFQEFINVFILSLAFSSC